MYSLEKLIQIPITKNPMEYISDDGCGCAWGLAYLAQYKDEDKNLGRVLPFFYGMKDSNLGTFLDEQEDRLFRAHDRNWQNIHRFRNKARLEDKGKSYEDVAASVKYEIIKYLVENGLTDAPKETNVKTLLNV
jgi:hypothetical protein